MQIERTNSEILVRILAKTDLTGLQRLLDYIKFREIASKSKATDEQINEFARESKASWWKKTSTKLLSDYHH